MNALRQHPYAPAETRPARIEAALPPARTIQYGPAPSQAAELYLPDLPHPPVICLLHGGWWRMPYGRDQMEAVARDLAGRGYAVWNIGYRRLGEPGGGWPGTFEDAAAALDHLAVLADEGLDIDLCRIVAVGHSAGGQLALWLASGRAARRIRPIAAAGLAAASDLARIHALDPANSVIAELLGGAPGEQAVRYRTVSPAELLPLGAEQLLIHGHDDELLPAQISRDYAQAARQEKDDVQCTLLSATGHKDFLDPHGEAHAVLCNWLEMFLARNVS